MKKVRILCCLLWISWTGQGQAGTRIEISTPMPPPTWALLERQLLDANAAAVEEFYTTYHDERGYLLHTPRWGTLDGTDDAIECYANWTLLHMLGASDLVLNRYKQGLEGHLLQYKELKTVKTTIAAEGAYYKEFLPCPTGTTPARACRAS